MRNFLFKITGAFLLALYGGCLSAGEYQTDFKKDSSAWIRSGVSEGFRLENGRFLFDSGKESAGTYRWGALKSPERMDGDFQAEFQYRILRLDHWNNFCLRIESAAKNIWSIEVTHAQRKPGENRMICTVRRQGKKEEKEWINPE